MLILGCNFKVCTQFESKIKGMKTFTRTFIDGSTNCQKSTVVRHNASDQHKEAMNEFRKARNEVPVLPPLQESIASSFQKLSEAAKVDLRRKIEVAHFVAKEELSLSKYSRIIALEKIHGVDHNETYNNRVTCRELVVNISDTMKDKLSVDVSDVKFVSLLWDGVTTTAVEEYEGVFIQFLVLENMKWRFKFAFLVSTMYRMTMAKGLYKP